MSDSEKPKKTTTAPTGTAAPPKKKKTLKQKLAEKERLAAEPVCSSYPQPSICSNEGHSDGGADGLSFRNPERTRLSRL